MNRYNLLPSFLYSPEGDPTGTPPAAPAAPVKGNPDPNASTEVDDDEVPEKPSKHASADELRIDNDRLNHRVTELIGEKRTLQAKNRTLKSDATALAAYQALGTPEEIATRLKVGDEAVQEKQTNAKKTGLAAATAVAGIDAEALSELHGALDVDYIVEGEGENAKAFVTYKENDKDVKKPLDEWARAKWPKSVDRLFSDVEAEAPPAKPAGTPYPKPAPSGGSTKPKSVFDTIREKNAKKAEENKRPTTIELANKAGMVRGK